MTTRAVTLLQLETQFPRIPGDIGCAETFAVPLERRIISGAHVGKIVSARPQDIEISAFEDALENSAELIATSCGFLSFWQGHLQALTPAAFVSSSLIDLPDLALDFSPEELAIVTFDASSLGNTHLPSGCSDFVQSIVGLPTEIHLRQVIERDSRILDPERASREIIAFLDTVLDRRKIKAILLECTNLPPYKHAMKDAFGVPVFDILTSIERRSEGSVNQNYL